MSTAPRDPGSDPAVAHLIERRPPEVQPEPSLLRDPARVLILVGSVAAIATSPLPWLVKVGGGSPETMTGWTGLFDGFLIAVVAGTLSWLVLNRDAARATTPIVRWLPVILGATAVVLGVSALRNVENQLQIWSRFGATGDFQPWLFVCLGGVAMIGVGTLLIAVRLWREPPFTRTGSRPVVASRAQVASVVVGTAGGLIGVAAAATFVLGLGIDPIAVSLPLMLATILGGLAGARIGARLGARLAGALRGGSARS